MGLSEFSPNSFRELSEFSKDVLKALNVVSAVRRTQNVDSIETA
jgi:hypothetical protein